MTPADELVLLRLALGRIADGEENARAIAEEAIAASRRAMPGVSGAARAAAPSVSNVRRSPRTS